MWPPQRGVGSSKSSLGKQIAPDFMLILHCDLILPLPSLSKFSYDLFELAPKAIRTLFEQLVARRTIFRTPILFIHKEDKEESVGSIKSHKKKGDKKKKEDEECGLLQDGLIHAVNLRRRINIFKAPRAQEI
jgi:hypothetical protein